MNVVITIFTACSDIWHIWLRGEMYASIWWVTLRKKTSSKT